MAKMKYVLYAHFGSLVFKDEKEFDTDDQELWSDIFSSAQCHVDEVEDEYPVEAPPDSASACRETARDHVQPHRPRPCPHRGEGARRHPPVSREWHRSR